MKQSEFLAEMARLLEGCGIPYMIAGSHASGYYGQPRTTQDVDLVIDPTPQQVNTFMASFAEPYYCSADAARDAVRRRSMFNVIHAVDGWKADFIFRKDRPFSVEEFRRRRRGVLHGLSLSWASAEDVILTKLEWNGISPSDRQIHDTFNVAVAQWDKLDRAYLREWATELGVAEPLEDLLQRVQEFLQQSKS